MSNTRQAIVAKADDSVTKASDSGSLKPAHIPQTTFDRLPTEIRLKIYEELLLTPHTIFITLAKVHDCDQSVLASFLLVNKDIRHEVLDGLRRLTFVVKMALALVFRSKTSASSIPT